MPTRPQDCTLAECEELARLMGSIPAPEPVELAMWHWPYLLFTARFPGLACPAELLERSQAAFREEALRGGLPTLLQRMLTQAVKRLAPGQQVVAGYAVEAPGGEGCLRVDVALPALHIVLEADGPHQFLRNRKLGGQPQPRGDTVARDRLLRALGWRVVSVPHTAWEDASGSLSGDQEELVRRLVSHLQQHTDLSRWLLEAAG